MKKILSLCLILSLILTLLCACAPDDREPYEFERKEIVELSVSDEQKNPVTLSNLKMMRLLDMIEALKPKATERYDDKSRKYYCLDIIVSVVKESQICLMDEYITIDGYIYDVTNYSPNAFISFFNDTDEQDSREPYKINRKSITKMEGTEQGNFYDKFEFSATEIESILDIIDGFKPKATDWYNHEMGGWSYFFNIYYEDGTKTIVSIRYNDITIDGYIYDVTDYSHDAFSEFFK